MEISGEYRLQAPRQKVWEALNDPEFLKQALPGCQEMEKVSDTEFNAKVSSKIGPVKASFNSKVHLKNLNPPESYTLEGEGKGGAAGFAKGSANVNLTEEGDETLLKYTSELQVGGKLAQIGSRLVGGAAKKVADEFFSNFAALINTPEAPTAPAETPSSTDATPAPAAKPTPAPAAAPTPPPAAAESTPMSPGVWIGVAVAVVVLLVIVFAL